MVVGTRHLQAFDGGADRGRFGRAELVVFQVDVVHHLREPGNRRIVDAELLAERFERAVLAAVRERAAEHVERDAARRRGVHIGTEIESGAAIYEAATSTRPSPRHSTPGSGRVTQRRSGISRSRVTRRFRGRQSARGAVSRREQREDAVASCRAEEIDFFDRRQPLAMARQVIASSRRGGGAAWPPEAASLRCSSAASSAYADCRDRRKLLDELGVRRRIDRVGQEHAGFAAGAFDLDAQPLEVFARFS